MSRASSRCTTQWRIASRAWCKSTAGWIACRSRSHAGLGDRIQRNAEVVAIDQQHGGVTITYRVRGARHTIRGDAAIVALPFSTLRLVETSAALSPAKLRVVRELPYETAIKTFVQTRRRFWEKDDRIFGGATVTDLPVRGIYYPDHGRDTGKGALLISYTWAEAAKSWATLAPADAHRRRRRRCGAHSSAAANRIRIRNLACMARGAVRPRCVRLLPAGSAGVVLRDDRRARGANLVRGRACIALARLDRGRGRLGPSRRRGSPRGALIARAPQPLETASHRSVPRALCRARGDRML